jgi:hypothetical protein
MSTQLSSGRTVLLIDIYLVGAYLVDVYLVSGFCDFDFPKFLMWRFLSVSRRKEAKTSLKRRGSRVWGAVVKDAVFCPLFTDTYHIDLCGKLSGWNAKTFPSKLLAPRGRHDAFLAFLEYYRVL